MTDEPGTGQQAARGNCKPCTVVHSDYGTETGQLASLGTGTRRTLEDANPVQSVQFRSVVQFYYACVVSPVLFRLCCFACVVSPVLFHRFGVGVVVVVVIIAFTLMPFAMFETSDRYLTQKLIMASVLRPPSHPPELCCPRCQARSSRRFLVHSGSGLPVTCYTMQYYIILYNTVRYGSILYHNIKYYTVFYYTILSNTTLYIHCMVPACTQPEHQVRPEAVDGRGP